MDKFQVLRCLDKIKVSGSLRKKLQKLTDEGKHVVPSYAELIELLGKVSKMLPKMRHMPDID